MFQKPLPAEITRLDPQETDSRIAAAREALAGDVLILGHHYQRDEIIRWADYRGDSLKLSQLAAGQPDARFIVFCGVHFMAESADILTNDDQVVLLPNLSAGCSMADMASIGQVESCWEELATAVDVSGVIPITYVNSSADIKAFVGRHEGAACTSSNARKVVAWALSRGEKLLFFPDQHLGRNTAVALGLDPDNDMLVWDPHEPFGGVTADQVRAARVILWKGHCSVHARFNTAQIAHARSERPRARVIVHPECSLDVVQAADENGSTEFIIKAVSESPSGTVWAVGTEINLVARLAAENPDKTIFCLDPIVCPCSTMYRIHPHYLLWCLESLTRGAVVNQIRVAPDVAASARIALDRMLSIT